MKLISLKLSDFDLNTDSGIGYGYIAQPIVKRRKTKASARTVTMSAEDRAYLRPGLARSVPLIPRTR